MAASTRDSAFGVRGAPSQGVASTAAGEDEYEEISLVDIVRVLHRRRVVLAVTLVLALVGGGALTVFTTPEYEAKATVIPLEHAEIIQNWLSSRQAAEYAAGSLGDRLYPVLFPARWDESTASWDGAQPSPAEIALALRGHVDVSGVSRTATTLTITASAEDPVIARDVAAAYLGSLDALRPQLENLTRSELFDKYYDGTNSQEAQRRAETAAREKSYWLVFDDPTIPSDPVKPRPVLYMALAGVLGIMGGVMLVFALEWMSKYRAELTRPDSPP